MIIKRENLFEKEYREKKQKKFSGWSKTDNRYDNMCSWIENTFNKMKINSGTVLDLGCGAGNLTLLLAKKFPLIQFYGIDRSETAITWAMENTADKKLSVEFRQGNVLGLPYPENSFDVLIDSFCFHCIIGKDRKLFLDDASRVLKINGLLIIMSKCGIPKFPDYPFDPVSRCKIVHGKPVRYWAKPGDLINQLKDSGFRILNYKIIEFDQDLFYGEFLKSD